MKRTHFDQTPPRPAKMTRFDLTALEDFDGELEQPNQTSPIHFSFTETPSPEGLFETTDVVFGPITSPKFGADLPPARLRNISEERRGRDNALGKSSKTTDIKPAQRFRLRLREKRRPKLKPISLLKSDKNLPEVPTAQRELKEIFQNAARY